MIIAVLLVILIIKNTKNIEPEEEIEKSKEIEDNITDNPRRKNKDWERRNDKTCYSCHYWFENAGHDCAKELNHWMAKERIRNNCIGLYCEDYEFVPYEERSIVAKRVYQEYE
ncbi:hypothetical protein [uncultured Arcobacter sp.]|uniref:hypothetical protein n=1 Tax=uncultured Arcobacter sp. TaxID=165434 RepID=UPI00260C1FF8|nr:hypothetical protein [uncultured Arcobacter sp.]